MFVIWAFHYYLNKHVNSFGHSLHTIMHEIIGIFYFLQIIRKIMYEGFGFFVVVALLRCWIEVQNTDHLSPFETKRVSVNVELMSILITI